jgi:2-aminoethylphosphonate-pyruvate transaminase
MIKTAVILAAGLGSRLRHWTIDTPKGLLVIDGSSLVEHSIRKLFAAGIDQIVIGTGHRGEAYERLAEQYPNITCVKNAQYETTGSMYTLYTVKDYLSDDFLLLESDLLYEQRALSALLEHNMPDVLLASQLTCSNDEVFVEADSNDCLVNLSKSREELGIVHAEMVGITKLSYRTFQAMCKYAEEVFTTNGKLDYEYALAGVAKSTSVYVHSMHNLAWCEIDNETHLDRAIQEVYPIVKARDMVSHPVKRNILLNPGPATTTDSVKFSQVVPDICPRESEFGEVLQWIATELTKFVANPNEYNTVLFGGSGTAAIEAILSSVVGQDALFIINNGAYGKRMCEIAQAYGLKYIEYQSSPFEPLDITAIEDAVLESPHKISHLAVVHNETTTGLLNDVKSLGDMCNRRNIHMIVDAMSSFAAVPIDMKAMNITYLAASSNKNLQGMPGIGFVVAHTERLEASRNIPPRNFYLHLYSQHKFFLETHQMRFTPPVQTIYAIQQAILETKFETIEQRYHRYCQLWDTLIAGITRLGLTHFVREENHSKIITSIVEPACDNYDFQEMHDYFYKHGFTIYPGKLDGFNTFRIANIGDLSSSDIDAFLRVLERYLMDIGYINP